MADGKRRPQALFTLRSSGQFPCSAIRRRDVLTNCALLRKFGAGRPWEKRRAKAVGWSGGYSALQTSAAKFMQPCVDGDYRLHVYACLHAKAPQGPFVVYS
ncbi:hypothetical protein J1614_010063 [Plenodomus biglobosus]|nr:hypothetical protein J1614_010063 [Plenodomus biglobosus]